MIAQGAEAKVYYREGDKSVVKERTSIYSTTQKALDAIALHNYLFPETAMHVIGFTRDNWSGQGVNYISDRMALEDMHPANVFIDEVSGCPICIDCIVKFI